MPMPGRRRWKRFALAALAAAALALIFAAYLRPAFVFDLANRISLCF